MSTNIVRANIAELEVAELEARYSRQDRLSKSVALFGRLMFASEERSINPWRLFVVSRQKEICLSTSSALRWLAKPVSDRKGVTSSLFQANYRSRKVVSKVVELMSR